MGGLKGFFKNPAKAIKGTGRWLDEQSGGPKKAQGPDSQACKDQVALCESHFNNSLASGSSDMATRLGTVAVASFVGAAVCHNASQVCAVPKK